MARESTSAETSAEPTKPQRAKKTRWYRQVWQMYQITQQFDRRTVWALAGITLGVVVVFVLVGGLLLHGQYWFWGVIGLMFGLSGAFFFLVRRSEVAAYSQIADKPGAALAALSTLRGGWVFAQEPVAVDPRTQDMVFRGVGRAGVVLVSEGPPHRAGRLLEAERKRCARVVGGAPITLVQMGEGDEQVMLRRLTRHMSKLKPVLTKQEVAAVNKRLVALGGVKMPVPKGIDPMRARPDRKGMRGR